MASSGRRNTAWRVIAALGLLSSAAMLQAQPTGDAGLWQGFTEPPTEARPMMRWWWFGPAVTPEEIDRELQAMKDGGIGGVEVQPVYPLQLDTAGSETANQRFLSPEFLSGLRHAAQTAQAQGLRIDVTAGSGWPFGGPQTTVDHASAEIRMVRVPVAAGETSAIMPAVGPGERLVAARIGPVTDEATADRPLQEVPIDQPRAELRASDQPRELLVFVAGRTGQMVKRPAIGAEGYVLDHIDPAAVSTHLDQVVAPLLTAFDGLTPPHAIFSDSLEAYGASWTPDLPAEFRRRRGYDLMDHLPALFLDTPDSAGVRYDWARTLSELVDERYLAPIDRWARDHGTQFRAQVYGFPPTTLSSNALVALPEGEGQNWRDFTSTRWATSGAHLYGKPVVSSETWTWLASPSWAATPLDMKMEADRHFLQGVTQLVGHGWPYSPPSAGEPGWSFYAAAALNDHNPWYPVMPSVSRYLARISYMLRQGAPDNQVALYLPIEDAFATMRPARASANEMMERLLPEGLTGDVLTAGYGFDFVDAAAVAADRLTHDVLLLPTLNRIDADAYAQVERWLDADAKHRLVVLEALPQTSGGLRDSAAVRQVRAISARLARHRSVSIVPASSASEALRAAAEPDMLLAEPNPAVGFVRRATQTADIYFVANTGNRPVRVNARFATRFGAGEWWNPMTGARSPAGDNEVTLELAPYESRLLVFGDAGEPAAEPAQHAAAFKPLSDGWSLRVDGKRVGSDALGDWTRDPELRHYSGVGNYTRPVQLDRVDPGLCYLLAFTHPDGQDTQPVDAAEGERHHAEIATPIRDAATIRVNGQEVGALWAPPYRIDITPALRAGRNTIEVAVANTALNQLAGEARTDYRLLNRLYGERFQPQDQARIASRPSGIVGNVSLATVMRGAPECAGP
ncbi:glycosyl hydrolase [Croceibacterium sp. TMG7-5b_MA50]|uniref:glycosyl hydrolase n=1 Tax=Croceibacterium sp. TMG7-5b_MA50 TaxID=3121290 RepID=UPI003221849D